MRQNVNADAADAGEEKCFDMGRGWVLVLTGIGIGANLGNREETMREAILILAGMGTEVRVAAFRETEPVDCPPGSPRFMNTVMTMEYRGDLMKLLHTMQNLEENAGREAASGRVTNGPRPLDLDLLFSGQQVVDSPELVLPHPRMMQRLFVLDPLMELMPDFRPHSGGPTVAERVRELELRNNDYSSNGINQND